MTRPGHVYPRADWLTVPAVVIASGPSLSNEQLGRVLAAIDRSACRVITVNNTCQRAPWAHAHYFGDYMACKEYVPALRYPNGPCRGEWWTGARAGAERYRMNHVKYVAKPGFGDELVHMGGNSGFQAINLAMLWGAKKILLLGFDMKRGEDGRDHWFGQHPPHLVQTQLYGAWIDSLTKAAPDASERGVDIVNVTPGSALDCFRRGELLQELAA